MKVSSLSKKIWSLTFTILILIPPFGCQNPAQAETPDLPPQSRNIKLALLLDTSGSMSGLIDQARAQLWKIVNQLATARCDGQDANLEIALYEYGNSRLTQSSGYIRQVQPLTTDLDEISESLFGLTTSGGDEYCGQVIYQSLNELDWGDEGDYKVVFIAGNEPFTQGTLSYEKACNTARSKDIVINTIHCGDFQTGISTYWKHGADLTGGQYTAIDHNSKTQFIPSPYDDDINALNIKLNSTYISYGIQGKAKYNKMVEQDANANGWSSENMAERVVSKSSKVYRNSTWDLVDASKEEDFEVEKIASKDLPREMQNMNTAQKNEYVAQKKKERLQIQNEIKELSSKRTAFLEEQKKAQSGDSQLGDALLKAIQIQATSKNFTFEK